MRVFFVSVLLLFPSLSSAQGLSGLTVGILLDQAEAAAKDFIDAGFDRLDMSMVRAGYEARDTIFSARQSFEGLLDQAADSFEEAREETLSDVVALTRTLEGSGENLVEDVRAASGEVLSTVTILLDDGVGSVHIEPAIARAGDQFVDLELRGVALSQLAFEEFTIDGELISPEIREQDDRRVIIRVPLTLTENAAEVNEALVRFTIRKPRWFEWLRGRLERGFGVAVVVIPREVGSITAVYSANQTTTTTVSRSESRETPRVQTSVRLDGFRRGEWSGSYNFSVAQGERLVRDSIHLSPSTNSGCHGSSTAASTGAQNEREFRIDVRIASDRRAGATCGMNLTVTYSVESDTIAAVERQQTASPVQFGERVVFRDAVVSEGVQDLRLAYVEIESPLFENGTRRLLPGEATEWAQLEVDAASGFSYVTVELQD